MTSRCNLIFAISFKLITELNRQMIATALDWLELNPQDHVLDLFCGMGNFTLPLSRKVKSAVGIEGVSAMVEKARANAERNGCHNVQFYRTDLDKPFINQPWAQQPFNKILLDPPRTGAAFALNALCQLQAESILYVSCNPATLVRDTEILRDAGYQLDKVAHDRYVPTNRSFGVDKFYFEKDKDSLWSL